MSDSLETIDGELVSAQIGPVRLDRIPLDGGVLIAVEGYQSKLTPAEVRQLVHALSCAFVPYGVISPDVDEPPC